MFRNFAGRVGVPMAIGKAPQTLTETFGKAFSGQAIHESLEHAESVGADKRAVTVAKAAVNMGTAVKQLNRGMNWLPK